MAHTPLSTDFKDDILHSSVERRKYHQIFNEDGSVSFVDVTPYLQTGSVFGAKEVNEERNAINNIDERRIVTLDEIDLVTEEGFFVDALAVKELNGKITSGVFSPDEIDTGETMFGKKVYRKTLKFTDTVTGGTRLSKAHGISADHIWIDLSNSYMLSNNNSCVSVPFAICRYDQIYEYVSVKVTASTLYIDASGSWNQTWVKVVTIKYTKP